MTTAWYVTPSARPAREAQACFDAWRDVGCAVAVTRKVQDLQVDLLITLPSYPGLWKATNHLAAEVLARDPRCSVVVTGGDDVWPDSGHRADDVAAEFIEHFEGTLGVMQPVKDDPPDHARLCWSPWMGREWCLRAFGGRGATEPEFWHYFGDSYLWLAAERLGLLWAREDLSHEHRNWKSQGARRPRHLEASRDRWADDKALHGRLVAEGFPGADLW